MNDDTNSQTASEPELDDAARRVKAMFSQAVDMVEGNVSLQCCSADTRADLVESLFRAQLSLYTAEVKFHRGIS